MAITPGGRVGDASPVGTPGGTPNWVDKAGGLPDYVREVTHALIRKGVPKDKAIATAVATMKRWAAGAGNVSPKVRAAAAKAVAEWEAKRGAAHVSLAVDTVLEAVANGQLDLADAQVQAVIDLAPGDYRPPYDWKHGYIPITPAAAMSKAKGSRKRATKLMARTHGVSAQAAARELARAKGGTGKRVAGQKSAKVAGMRAKAARDRLATAKDNHARGRGSQAEVAAARKQAQRTAAEVQAAKTPAAPKTSAPGPSNADMIRNAETMYGTGSKQHLEAQRRFGGKANMSNDGNTLALMQRTTPEQRKAMAEGKAKSDASRTEQFAAAHPIGTKVEVQPLGNKAEVVGHSPVGVKVKFDSGRTAHVPSENLKHTGGNVASLDAKRAEKAATGTPSGPGGSSVEADRARAAQLGYDQHPGHRPNGSKFDSHDQIKAFLDAKDQGHQHYVGQAVNARQPGIDRVTAGRVVGHDKHGMVKVQPHAADRHGNKPVGTFNPSHVAPAGQEPRNTPDSREPSAIAKRLNAPEAQRARLGHSQGADQPKTPAPKGEAAKAADITVEHTAEGTLVHGTSRGDTGTTDALKAQGFRWSRNLGAWYLPRNLTHDTRDRKVNALKAALGDKIHVQSDGKRMTAAERDAAQRERAAQRADRMSGRAEKLTAESEARRKASDQITNMIPMGQPILVGHHSEGRHRRDIARAHSNMEKSWEAQKGADAAKASAERAQRTAAGDESKVTIANRLDKNRADLRRVEKKLKNHATAEGIVAKVGENHKAAQLLHGDRLSPAYKAQLEGMAADLRDRVQHDEGKLAAAGGIAHGKDTVKAGDMVKIRGQWYPVARSNAKSVTIPSIVGGSWTDTSPWQEVQDHKPASAFTEEQLGRLVEAQKSPAAKKALEKALADKRKGAAGKADAPAAAQETPAAAAGATPKHPTAMTPDELDAEVADLAANGDFGARMEALAAEMDRRQAPAPVTVPDRPDPDAERRALNKLLYGDENPAAPDLTKRRGTQVAKDTSRNREKQLRGEYDAYTQSQYLAALDATNGYFFNPKASRLGERPFDEGAFFDGRATPAQIRKYASEELLTWFGTHPRMSFDEWRSFIVDDKKARSAQTRLRERTMSEWG